MDFFHSLTLDLKILLVAIVGCVLLALFSGNRQAEKRYMLVLVVLAAAGVYRFTRVMGDDPAHTTAASRSAPHMVTVPDTRKKIESTSAR